jgi:hypothetical protein
MMGKAKAARPEDLNWSEYEGSLPSQGVVRPQGANKTELAARMRKAFAKAKVRQTA